MLESMVVLENMYIMCQKELQVIVEDWDMFGVQIEDIVIER